MAVQETASEEQLAALRAEHGGAMLRMATGLTRGDRGRAEDLVQETLIRAWQHPEILANGPARPWLLRVLRNLCTDAHRARQHRPAEVSQEALGAGPAIASDLDQVLDAQIIAAALARLSHRHRQVVIEVFYHHRPVADAAAVLGIPPGTVKSRTYHALRQLRLALTDMGMAPPDG